MLPADISYSHLDLWIQSWRPEAVDTLRDAALVLVSGSKREEAEIRLFVLPVVQSYMQHSRIPADVRQGVYEACHGFLNAHRSPVKRPNGSQFQGDIAAIGTQEINIEALLTECVKDATSSQGVDS